MVTTPTFPELSSSVDNSHVLGDDRVPFHCSCLFDEPEFSFRDEKPRYFGPVVSSAPILSCPASAVNTKVSSSCTKSEATFLSQTNVLVSQNQHYLHDNVRREAKQESSELNTESKYKYVYWHPDEKNKTFLCI